MSIECGWVMPDIRLVANLRLLLMDFDIDNILEHEAASAEDPSARATKDGSRWLEGVVALFEVLRSPSYELRLIFIGTLRLSIKLKFSALESRE